MDLSVSAEIITTLEEKYIIELGTLRSFSDDAVNFSLVKGKPIIQVACSTCGLINTGGDKPSFPRRRTRKAFYESFGLL